MAQTVYMYMHGIGEEKAVEDAIIKNNTKISVLAVCVVLCTLSDNTCTYVQVHVCGSARSGGAQVKKHVRWHATALSFGRKIRDCAL